MSDKLINKPEILVVDDSRVIRHAATKMLGGDYAVSVAENGAEGWQQLRLNDAISVAFVDMQMPEMNGLDLLTQIRNSEDERLASLPVIIITGSDDTESTKKQIFDAGATDFITKPFDSIDLISRAKSYARLNSKVVELEKKASHDRITGLFSAAGFEEQGARALSFAMRHGLDLSVVSLEIIDFRKLYQSYGKRIAQQIIVTVAKRLDELMRAEDIAARTGLSKYALLLPLTSEVSARIVIDRVSEAINKLVFDTDGNKVHIRLAFGLVALSPVEGQEFSGIVSQADAALARAITLDDGTGGGLAEGDTATPSAAAPEPVITDALVSEMMQHIIAGDYSCIPDYLLLPVAERLAPFLDYVNSRPGQRVMSAGGTGER